MRLALRELIWFKFASPSLKVIFGYDYYMYFRCQELSVQAEMKIAKLGLFVELNVPQRTSVVVNKQDDEIK